MRQILVVFGFLGWKHLDAMLCCHMSNRCLVQPLLSSSYQGFGVSSLDKDAEELHHLIESLNTEFASQVCSAASTEHLGVSL